MVVLVKSLSRWGWNHAPPLWNDVSFLLFPPSPSISFPVPPFQHHAEKMKAGESAHCASCSLEHHIRFLREKSNLDSPLPPHHPGPIKVNNIWTLQRACMSAFRCATSLGPCLVTYPFRACVKFVTRARTSDLKSKIARWTGEHRQGGERRVPL